VEITFRDAVTVVHGMFFGALLLLGFSGAVAILYATSAAREAWTPTRTQLRALTLYLVLMAGLAWVAVLLGAYVVYPWYRAVAPPGTVALGAYPQRLLMSNPLTSGWHDIGMEWKEHIAWFAPIALTAAAAIFGRYGAQLRALQALRRALFGLVLLAFACAGVAGFFGAMLNKYAPVRGGSNVILMRGDPHG